MKIKPVILCGGAGTRLWPKSKKNLPKQFVDWGGWTLFDKTLTPKNVRCVLMAFHSFYQLILFFLLK